MSRLVWDQTGQKTYETGTDHAVLYPTDNTGAYTTGVAWNGITGFTESPSGAENTDLWADNIKYVSLRSAEDYGATIEAYTYPDEFKPCIGEAEAATGVNFGQQKRRAFGFTVRTTVGNDTLMDSYGYKLHIIYGCTASPSERAYQTINDSPEAITFSWEVTTTPVAITTAGFENYKPTASVIIDSTKADKTKLASLEAILYGSDNAEPRIPTPDEILAIFK